MITDAFFFIISWFMIGFRGLLSIITWVIPSGMTTAINQYVAYLHYLQGIFPIVPVPTMTGLVATTGIVTIFDFSLKFLLAWYSFKLVLFLLNAIPIFGKYIHLKDPR